MSSVHFNPSNPSHPTKSSRLGTGYRPSSTQTASSISQSASDSDSTLKKIFKPFLSCFRFVINFILSLCRRGKSNTQPSSSAPTTTSPAHPITPRFSHTETAPSFPQTPTSHTLSDHQVVFFTRTNRNESQISYHEVDGGTSQSKTLSFNHYDVIGANPSLGIIHVGFPSPAQFPPILLELVKEKMGELYHPEASIQLSAKPEDHQFYFKAGFKPIYDQYPYKASEGRLQQVQRELKPEDEVDIANCVFTQEVRWIYCSLKQISPAYPSNIKITGQMLFDSWDEIVAENARLPNTISELLEKGADTKHLGEIQMRLSTGIKEEMKPTTPKVPMADPTKEICTLSNGQYVRVEKMTPLTRVIDYSLDPSVDVKSASLQQLKSIRFTAEKPTVADIECYISPLIRDTATPFILKMMAKKLQEEHPGKTVYSHVFPEDHSLYFSAGFRPNPSLLENPDRISDTTMSVIKKQLETGKNPLDFEKLKAIYRVLFNKDSGEEITPKILLDHWDQIAQKNLEKIDVETLIKEGKNTSQFRDIKMVFTNL